MNITPIDGVADSAQVVLEGSPAADAVADALSKIPEGTKALVIVVGSVRYLNSQAVNAVVEAAQKVKAGGGSTVIVGVSPKLKLTLENLGVDEFFAFEETEEDAKSTLAGGAG